MPQIMGECTRKDLAIFEQQGAARQSTRFHARLVTGTGPA